MNVLAGDVLRRSWISLLAASCSFPPRTGSADTLSTFSAFIGQPFAASVSAPCEMVLFPHPTFSEN